MKIIKKHITPKPKRGEILTDKNGSPVGIVLDNSNPDSDTVIVGVAQDEEERQEVKEEDVKQHCQVRKDDPEFIKKLKGAKVKASLNERAKLIKAKKAYYDAVGWADNYK